MGLTLAALVTGVFSGLGAIALHYVLEPFRAGDETKDDKDVPVYNSPEEARKKLALIEDAYAQAQKLLGVGPASRATPHTVAR